MTDANKAAQMPERIWARGEEGCGIFLSDNRNKSMTEYIRADLTTPAANTGDDYPDFENDKAFVFDPATGYFHADDGINGHGGIKWVREEYAALAPRQVPETSVSGPAQETCTVDVEALKREAAEHFGKTPTADQLLSYLSQRGLIGNAHAAQDGWQPIETAPKDGTNILVCLYRAGGDFWGQVVVCWSDCDNDGYLCDGHWSGISGKDNSHHTGYTPIYWKPLDTPPAAPKPEGV